MAAQTIAVWFSCGAASAVAAKLTLDQYRDTHNVRVLNNPVVEEGADNRRFCADVAAWLGVSVESVTHPEYPSASAREVWEHRGGMAFREMQNRAEWHVLGFTAEERGRHDRFVLTERSNVLPVLIEAGLTKQDCLDYLAAAGIAPPSHYARGYPNANCIGCVKATSPTYWNLVRTDSPDVFADRAEQSRRLGARLARHKGKRVFLDELPADAIGRPLKTLRMPECGSFCEEAS